MAANRSDVMIQSMDDWRNHLRNGCVFYEEEGMVIPLLVNDLTYRGGDPHHTSFSDLRLSGIRPLAFSEKEGGNRNKEVSKKGDDCFMAFPPVGMANCEDGTAKYLYYSFRRQFRKTLNNNVLFFSPVHFDAAHMVLGRAFRRMPPRGLPLHELYNSLNGLYTPANEAYAKIMEGEWASRALSQNFALAATTLCDYPALVYRNTDVGYMRDDTFYVHESYSELANEFEEALSQGVTLYE